MVSLSTKMWHVPRRSLLTRLLVAAGFVLFFTVPGAYAVAMYFSPDCGNGSNNIPDASDSNTPGVYTCSISISDLGVIPFDSNPVTVTLIGLQHEAAGDLIATVQHFADMGETIPLGPPQTLFYRIGKFSNSVTDFGSIDGFGNCLPDGLCTTDDYIFNSGFPVISGSTNGPNIWDAAGCPTGSTPNCGGAANTIPGLAQGSAGYWPTDGYASGSTGGPANGFSNAFGGQVVSGSWRLTITDNAPGPTGAPGSLLQWELDINVPEPNLSAWVGLLLAGGGLWQRLRKSVVRPG
jgi:hypothetical protein